LCLLKIENRGLRVIWGENHDFDLRTVVGRGTAGTKIELKTEMRAGKIPKACAGGERCLKALDR